MEKTALVLIDVYNDFLHPDGKATAALSDSLTASGTIKHIQQALTAARSAKIPVYYSLHQQYHDGKYAGFERWNPMLRSIESTRAFEEGSFGAEIYKGLEPDPLNGDTVISKHWNQSSFKNTDLDWLLRQKNITNLVFAGLVANTCIETTARMANEEGYKVTMLNDATAGWTIEAMKAAVEQSWPSFAHEVISAQEWQDRVSRG
ncbi:Isochorismatase-like protein [Stachybotrys elegans]|uniref:Isochorismatase-like protein n=1 Tax=Stachybotrys elegans TaxID=80388 RepID=A0A8K0WQL2_9HYPO|nr:Isochorismatase-like protein [Stachybotrys elegans]